MATETIEGIEAEIERLREKRRGLIKDELKARRERLLDDLKFFHEEGCLADKLVDACRDKKGIVNFGRMVSLRGI